MRARRLALIVCLVSLSTLAQSSSSGVTGAPRTVPAASIIAQSLATLNGGLPVSDVTMKGAYTVTDADGTKTGTITMVATASGQGQSTVSLPSGSYTEIRSVSASSASMIETGPDGVPHAISNQTALSPNPAWFCPALILASASSPNYSSSYIGQETLDGKAVHHLAVWRLPASSSPASPTLTRFWQHITQHDIYLDASSLLPVSMTFLLHPYDPRNSGQPLITYRGSNLDGTVQLWFSDYQGVQGRPVALHIHGTLKIGVRTVTSDIQISSVTFNTGAIVNMPATVN